ncbi:hypothetical protein SteCoe_33457 [Stentor coeruleus]|uniref:non-specific serine/threonine protein kinase n=1 Tax=Stentor coeruleus TaxID=5963 RepID=A0A1R2AWS5_9CILI|nr:hypothetical protein SteCoe_33457 [Stentor coeruleus]
MGACFSNNEECDSFPKAIEHSNGLPIDQVYKLSKKIGGGSFGTVWLAHRKDNHKYKFAIKKINKKEVENTELDLLRREIDVLREVDHPNIIKFYDTYEDSNHIFIVMEYCSGGELFTKITSQGYLHESEARVYMRKMLMAVSHLHSLKIVHRDLKTENFLFDSNCATKELKLVDFGLSNKFGKNFEQLHSQVGTIYYVAPEVLKGNYDCKCDMWSLGVLMYTMLSGDLPFFDNDLGVVYKKLNSGTYSFSKKVWESVSGTAKDLLSNLLVVDSEKRYSAMDALHHEWFVSLQKRESLMTASIYESFKNFRRNSIFQREALRLMVKHIPEERLERLKDLFFSLDTSGSGLVKVEDLINSLKELGSLSEREIIEVISSMDSNNTGMIYYSDFISGAIMAKKETMEEALWLTFKQLDVDNKGVLTEESLRRALEYIGRHVTDEQIQSIIETVNSSGGLITYEDFKEIIYGTFESRA